MTFINSAGPNFHVRNCHHCPFGIVVLCTHLLLTFQSLSFPFHIDFFLPLSLTLLLRDLTICITHRLSYKKRELLALLGHLSSPPFFGGVCVAHLFSFMCCGFFGLVSCAQCCCVWIVLSWWPLLPFLTFLQTMSPIRNKLGRSFCLFDVLLFNRNVWSNKRSNRKP